MFLQHRYNRLPTRSVREIEKGRHNLKQSEFAIFSLLELGKLKKKYNCTRFY